MNQRQRSIRAGIREAKRTGIREAKRTGIREAKRTGQPFHMVEVAPCTEPKVVDEAKVKAAIATEQAKQHPDKRKIKHLKSKIA